MCYIAYDMIYMSELERQDYINICEYEICKVIEQPHKTTITFEPIANPGVSKLYTSSNLLGSYTELTENCYDYGLL